MKECELYSFLGNMIRIVSGQDMQMFINKDPVLKELWIQLGELEIRYIFV